MTDDDNDNSKYDDEMFDNRFTQHVGKDNNTEYDEIVECNEIRDKIMGNDLEKRHGLDDRWDIFLKTIVDLPKKQVCNCIIAHCRLLLGIPPRDWAYPQVDQFKALSACALISVTNSLLHDRTRAVLIDEIINAYITNYMKVLYINSDIVPMCLMDIITTLATSMCSKFDYLIKLLCAREYVNDGKRIIAESNIMLNRFEIKRLSDYDTYYMTNPLINRLYQIIYTKYSDIIVAGTTTINMQLCYKYNNNLPLLVQRLINSRSQLVKKAADALITSQTIATMSQIMSRKINNIIVANLMSPAPYIVVRRFLECGYRPFGLIKLMHNHKHHRVYKLLQMFAG